MTKELSVTRRDFLGMGLGMGMGAYAILGGLPRFAWADNNPQLAGKTLNLVLRYRTDPARIARVLPPALEVDEEADVMVDWWVRYPTPGTETVFYPDVYSECGVHVTAKYQGRRGMFQIGMPLDQDLGRTLGRENVGLMKKDGVLSIQRQGKVVTGELHRRGKLLYRVRTEILDEPAHPLYWHRETGFGAFLYRYRLNPNWQQGPLGDDPVELWLRVLGGKRGFYPETMTPGSPRACDFARTQFEFVDPSVLDPFCEFPLRKIVGMSYNETGYAAEDEAAYRKQMPRTPTRIERLQLIDSKAFEPWALVNYDRPITAGKAWVSVSWPEKTTALKLSAAEIQQYRARSTLNLDLTQVLQLDWQIDANTHARTLPPQVKPGSSPMLRILALNVGVNDLSTESFKELWLLSHCEYEGKAAWYALSHVVGAGGDVIHGRETFGYPSRMGVIEWSTKSAAHEISGRRLGREFVRLQMSRAGKANAITEQMQVLGLRVHPAYRIMTLTGFTEPGAQADLVGQPWSLELNANEVSSARCRLEFPTAPGPGKIGACDPWYEFKQGKLISARAGTGILRRHPGAELAQVPDYKKYYLERLDGSETSEGASSDSIKHTFLI